MGQQSGARDRQRSARVRLGSIGGTALITTMVLAGCGEPETAGGPPLVRRLTEAQYRQSIADLFGPEISVVGRFEPELRVDGLFAVGASAATITSGGLEQLYRMAGSIAEQVFDESRRERAAPCPDPSGAERLRSCASAFVRETGRRLFRRNLDDAEVGSWTDAAVASAEDLGGLYAGLEQTLAGMLVSSEFLFRIDRTEPDPNGSGERLSAYSKASRLSFLLWNSSPDAELLEAAGSGALHDPERLAEQVERMVADRERLERGVRAFLSDFLRLEAFETLEKDKLIYPAFDRKVADDAREQVLRFAVDHLVKRGRDYRELFTSRETFMTRPLGMLSAVPVVSREGWERFEFPENDPRGGLLSHVAFTALHSHPGRSSATLRGIAVREILLCQQVAPAPAAVSFTVVQDTSNPDLKTARERLTAHRTDPECAGCHRVIDPIGLALEHFDGAGMYRELENGEPIDTSGELDGTPFENAKDLGQALRNHPDVPSCFISSLYRYAAGRTLDRTEEEWLEHAEERFLKSGIELIPLLRWLATSEALYRVGEGAPPRDPAERSA